MAHTTRHDDLSCRTSLMTPIAQFWACRRKPMTIHGCLEAVSPSDRVAVSGPQARLPLQVHVDKWDNQRYPNPRARVVCFMTTSVHVLGRGGGGGSGLPNTSYTKIEPSQHKASQDATCFRAVLRKSKPAGQQVKAHIAHAKLTSLAIMLVRIHTEQQSSKPPGIPRSRHRTQVHNGAEHHLRYKPKC